MPQIPIPADPGRAPPAIDADGRLVCAHCGGRAKPHAIYSCRTERDDPLGRPVAGRPSGLPAYMLSIAICSVCDGDLLTVLKWAAGPENAGICEWQRRVYPLGRAVHSFPNAPTGLINDYREACAVFEVSPAASACMARRCLQAALQDQGYQNRDLAKQIDAVLREPDPQRTLPTSLQSTVDAIRRFGNFGAHPINDITTLQIIAVEPNEAEWCIELCEELIDHYYEKPAARAAKVAALNGKLAASGKPPIKA